MHYYTGDDNNTSVAPTPRVWQAKFWKMSGAEICVLAYSPTGKFQGNVFSAFLRAARESLCVFSSRAPSGNPVVERSPSLASTCQAEIQSSPALSLEPNPAPQSVHRCTTPQKRWGSQTIEGSRHSGFVLSQRELSLFMMSFTQTSK